MRGVPGNRYPYRDSGDVYENKGNLDKMASKKSDIYRKVKRFSRDLQICGPKLPVNCAFYAGSS